MLINYWMLFVALVLLWFPRQWLRAGKPLVALPNVRRLLRTGRGPNDDALRWREELFKLRNWIDLFRGAIGAYALLYVCVDTVDGAAAVSGRTLLLLKAGVLLIAVLIQTTRYASGSLALVAPVFFIFGLGFALNGWIAALLAIITTCVLNRALRNVSIFLFVFAGVQIAFGLALKRSSSSVVLIAAVLTWLPVFWSLVTHRPLERAARQRDSLRS